MCKITQGFRLCSCNGTPDEDKPYWILSRKDPANEIFLTVGQTMAPYNAPPNREDIADELNNREVFDFEYVPQEYDLIEFYGLQYRHKYQFLQGSWTFVTQPLMGVSIIEHRSGRIK